jgi:thiol-disulfide isomerase/thioredoxin
MKPSLALAITCCALLGAGCGGNARAPEGTTAAEAKPRPPSEPDAVELTLRTAEGPLVFVGDLRGRPVLLFMFATFDALSQAALLPLEQFVQAYPDDVQVLGIAIEPDAERLIQHYMSALSPPFPVAYDPEGALDKGDTPIGKVDVIPSYVMLDAVGRPVARHVGLARLGDLQQMLRMAEEAVPPDRAKREREPPPLMGNPRR